MFTDDRTINKLSKTFYLLFCISIFSCDCMDGIADTWDSRGRPACSDTWSHVQGHYHVQEGPAQVTTCRHSDHQSLSLNDFLLELFTENGAGFKLAQNTFNIEWRRLPVALGLNLMWIAWTYIELSLNQI